MSPDVLLECPRTSFRDVLRVNVTERVWIFPPPIYPPPRGQGHVFPLTLVEQDEAKTGRAAMDAAFAGYTIIEKEVIYGNLTFPAIHSELGWGLPMAPKSVFC